MSGEKYFECILIYSALDIEVSKNQYFRSQEINIEPHHASKIVLLTIIFDSKRDAAGDDAPSEYSSLSPPTVSLTLYGSDFRRRYSHTKLEYVTVGPLGTSSFLINYIVLVSHTRLSIPLASLPISFPTDFHQVLLSPPIHKVSIVSFPP